MWGVIPLHLRRNRSISDKAKILYAELSDSTDDQGFCNKSNEELGENLGVAESTVRNYLYELRDYELICVDGDGRGRKISFPERMVSVSFEKEKIEKKARKVDLANEVASIWNELITTSRGINVTDNLIKTVTTRAKSFTDEDIVSAVRSRANFVLESEWHNDPKNMKHRNDIYLVLRSDTDMEKHLYLTQTSKKNVINVHKL